MNDTTIKSHDAYDSACENVQDLWIDRNNGKLPTIQDWKDSLDAEAVSQARELIDAGECCCCEGKE